MTFLMLGTQKGWLKATPFCCQIMSGLFTGLPPCLQRRLDMRVGPHNIVP